MAKRPTKTKPKQGKAPRAGGSEPGPVAAQNVILEQMQGQMNVVIEAVTMTRDTLRQEMRELGGALSSRMDTLEFAVRKNSADLRQNSADIQTLTVKVEKNSADIQTLTVKVEKNSADIQTLTVKVEKNSFDIQSVGEKLDTKTGASRTQALEERVEALELPVD